MLHNLKLWFKRCLSLLTVRLLGPHVHGVLVRADPFQFLVDPQDYGVGRHLRLQGHYGRDELERLAQMIDPQSSVLVVGTHVGTLAIPLASQCRIVHAIEANPFTFELLSANKAINRTDNLHLHNVAASDEERPLEFLANRSNSGGSKIVPQTKDYQYYYDKPDQITVPGCRLDDRFTDQQFDLIVMDIEGSEYRALRGMPRLLGSAKCLVVEFVPHHLRNVSNVSVKTFLSTVETFDRLTVPTKNVTVGREQFESTLDQLYRNDQSDDGIIFHRS